MGGCVMVRPGHLRSDKGMAGKAWYLVDGCKSIHSSGKKSGGHQGAQAAIVPKKRAQRIAKLAKKPNIFELNV
jgi:hypothetical protein